MPGMPASACCSCGQGGERGAQLGQVPRPRRAQGDSRDDSFQVADGCERFGDGRVLGAVHQGGDRVVARAQGVAIPQRPMQPTAQHPAAHGGRRAVEDARQGQLGLSGEALVELEVAASGGVHDQRRVALLGGDGQQMRQRRFLRFANIGEQRAGRRDSQAACRRSRSRRDRAC